jgi:peptidoglycan glycosyltransferase
MNTSIGRLFWGVALLFALLIAFTSRWTVFEASALREQPSNKRPLIEELFVKRGAILASDGTVLARSVQRANGTYQRRYPTDGLFAQAVGYNFLTSGSSGIERYRNDILSGRKNELISAFDSIIGEKRQGEDIQTTLDAAGQRAATAGLSGQKGAVVALDVKTGAVLAMASTPSYDPNGLSKRSTFGALSTDHKGSPLFNRATQAGYPPGSTFKVVTATAALDSGKFTPSSILNGNTGKVISAVPLANFGNKSWGDISLTTALTYSVNTVWAQVGEALGRDRLGQYMDRFGFYSKPPLDYPDDQLLTSGLRRRDNGKLLPVSNSVVDVGRTAIGQERLKVSPLQMATVAATVANRGVRMKPFLTKRVIDSDGRTVEKFEPSTSERVMRPQTAEVLTSMMKNVVKEGSGTAAALSGVQVAGKTGTAEVDPSKNLNHAWFIGFTPRVAVAVVVENVQGQGGTVAAPIARNVLQTLDSQSSNRSYGG